MNNGSVRLIDWPGTASWKTLAINEFLLLIRIDIDDSGCGG